VALTHYEIPVLFLREGIGGRMKNRVLIALALAASLALGCGQPHLVATVSPTQASVKAGGTVNLTGDQSGFTNEPLMDWWIQESYLANTKKNCGMFDYVPKDFTGCPFGFVVYRSEVTFPGTAVYYAPQTPGVYHVTVYVVQVGDWSSLEARTATAEITVTP
jgi:hypothetical protein